MNFPESGADMSEYLLKLKNGESVKGVFRGEVHLFRQHWENKQPSTCIGNGCDKCKTTKPTFRFRINFITSIDGQYTVKIWEQGYTVFKQLSALNKEYALEKNVVKISREGSTINDTFYNVLPIPNGLVSEALEATLSKIVLHNLVDEVKEKPPHSTDMVSDNKGYTEEDIPF